MRPALYALLLGAVAGPCLVQPAGAAVVLAPVDTLSGGALTSQLTTIAGTGMPGDTRLFLTTKTGRISTYRPETGSFASFADLSGEVVGSSSNEMGLLGLAFDPGYATNGYLYAYLTVADQTGGINAQVRRLVDPAIATGSASVVWTMPLNGSTQHLGGWIDFDATGQMLIAIGDGHHPATGQDPGDWFGSILRIDPHRDDFPADPARNYGIPGDNPAIYDDPAIAGSPAPEIFAYGLRNPFRNTVAPDGNLIVADVGEDGQEELTILRPDDPRRNLGWALREGDLGVGPDPVDYLGPDLTYDHSQGAAIIGGFVYRGSDVPELFGRYVFGDEVSGNIWSIGYEDGAFLPGTLTLLGNIPSISSFGESADGELYAVRFTYGEGAGHIFAISSDGVLPPSVPEPASWAMMIGGFAGAGLALRRRGVPQAARRAI